MFSNFASTAIFGLKSWDDGTCFEHKTGEETFVHACEGKDLNPEIMHVIGNVMTDLTFIAGVVLLIMIVIAGIRYATSGGSSDKVKNATDTITKASIGSLICLLSSAIIGFISKQVFGDTKCQTVQATVNTRKVNLKNMCTSQDSLILNLVNLLMFIVGIVSVVMIVLSGIRYMTANGNQDSMKKARQSLIFALIGLAVAIMAAAIANFVIGIPTGTSS